MFQIFDDVTEQQRHAVFASITTIFTLMAGHLLVETARDAVFLANLPASQLPILYIVIAVLSLMMTRVQRFITGYVDSQYVLVGWLVIGGLINLGLWAFLDTLGSTGVYVLYVVPGVVLTVALIQYWVLLGSSLTVGDAKSIYVLIGAGGGLGAIAGSGAAAAIASQMPAKHLLLVAAGVFFVAPVAAVWMIRALPEERDKHRSERELGSWEAVKSHLQQPYLLRIAAFSLLIPMAATVADYLFKSLAADRVEAASLGSFLGFVYLGLNVLSLVIQLSAVRRTIRRLSIAGALAVLPLLITLGGTAVLLGFAFFGAIGLKVVDGALRHSLHDTAEELLYVPLSKTERKRLKAFAAVLGKRGGQAIASVGLLGLVAVGAGNAVFGLFLAVIAGAAAWVALDLRHHYVEIFRARLRDEHLEHLYDFPELDVDSLERLVRYLSSPDDAEVLAAIDLLQEEGRTRTIPGLILYHPSKDVVLSALSAFVEDDVQDILPVLERIEQQADPELHAALLSAYAALDPDQEWLADHLESDDDIVRSIAMFHMVAQGWRDRSEGDLDVLQLLEDGNQAQKRALIFAIGVAGASDFIHELVMMLDDEDLGVRLESVRAMKAIGEEACKDALRWRLPDREIRDELVDAFRELGDDGFIYLIRSLDDESLPPRVRWQVPRALGSFGRSEAGEPMANRLPKEEDGKVRARLVDEMERLLLFDESLELPEKPLRESVDEHLERAYRLLNWRLELDELFGDAAFDGVELLSKLLRDKEQHATEMVLRISGLSHAYKDMRRARHGLEWGDDVERASAVELLEINLPSDLRQPVVGLVEQREDALRLRAGSGFIDEDSFTRETLLERLLKSRSEIVGLLVVDVAVDAHTVSVVEGLEEARSWAGDELRKSLDTAIARLNHQTGTENPQGASHA